MFQEVCVLRSVEAYGRVLQGVAACCSVLQRVAACGRVMQCVAVRIWVGGVRFCFDV